MFKRTIVATAVAAGMAFAAAPATAQQNGLVNVTVGDVILRNILSSNEIDVLRNANVLNNNQLLVQVPVGIAANVCPNVNILGAAAQRVGACTATAGSQALANQIRRQHLRQR